MNSPKEIANNYIAIGKGKVNTPVAKMFVLGILAGIFIAFGGVASTAAAVSIPLASVGKFLGACIFPGGLTMVLLAGSELFTGNCLLVNNGLAASMISTAAGKVSLSFGDAFLRGIACNFLVCIAVWISFAAKQVSSKIIGLFFPIMMFVLCGFEHSVANMYYIAAGIFAKGNAAYLEAATAAGADVSGLTWGAMFTKNLLPVTLGNIIGGAVLVGLAYWFVYLKDD